ncbi:MAG: hypothetical protein K6A44_02510 [bacterium]|nr:hypothetical protein [bacterium]
MISVSGIRNVVKGVTKAFGSSLVSSPQAAQGASIFSGMVGVASKTTEAAAAAGKTSSGKKAVEIFLKRITSFFKSGLGKSEVQRLESLGEIQFMGEARDILAKKIGIPNELLPSVEILPHLANTRQVGHFDLISFAIRFSEEHVKKMSRAKLYSILAHEMQHCEQMLMFLRSKKIAPEVIEYFSKSYAENISELAIQNYKNAPMEFWEKLTKEKNLGSEIVEFARKVKAANEPELLAIKNELIQNSAASCADALKRIQQIAIEKMGVLPEEAEGFAKDLFEGYKNSIQSEGKGMKYYFSLAEADAVFRQIASQIRYKLASFSFGK